MEPAVEPYVTFAQQASQRFLKTFSFVPDDRLTWSPSPTAKSALQIAAHVAVSYTSFGRFLRGDIPSTANREELFAALAAAEKAITTREEAVRLIEQGTAEVVEMLRCLTPEQMAGTVQTPFGPTPMTFMVTLTGRHTDNHAAQIDYVQTLYGDGEFHV